jgi:hypothetical protein
MALIASQINDSVTYDEDVGIADGDAAHESNIYNIVFFNKKERCLLGQKQDRENIVFYLLYLLNLQNEVVGAVGIFELTKHMWLLNKQQIKSQDIVSPIIFSFVTPEWINEQVHGKIPEQFRDSTALTPSHWVNKYLQQQVSAQQVSAQQIPPLMQEYNKRKTDFCDIILKQLQFQNSNYAITIEQLRHQMVNLTTQHVFNYYRESYSAIAQILLNTTDLLTELRADFETQTRLIQEELDHETLINYMNASKEIETKLLANTRKKNILQQMMKQYSFMRNITHLESFQNLIYANKIPVDIWILSLLEKILKIKFIMLSKPLFQNGDIGNVIRSPINQLTKHHKPDPNFFITVEDTKTQFNIIAFEHITLLTFNELPTVLQAGIYSKINNKINNKINKSHRKRTSSRTNKTSSKRWMKLIGSNNITRRYNNNFSSTNLIDIVNLYDEHVILVFHQLSNDFIPLGEENGEFSHDIFQTLAYIDLQSVENWRQKLYHISITYTCIDDLPTTMQQLLLMTNNSKLMTTNNTMNNKFTPDFNIMLMRQQLRKNNT